MERDYDARANVLNHVCVALAVTRPAILLKSAQPRFGSEKVPARGGASDIMYLGVGGPNLRFCDCAPPRGRKLLGVLSVRSANLLKNVHLQTSDHRREQLNENMRDM